MCPIKESNIETKSYILKQTVKRVVSVLFLTLTPMHLSSFEVLHIQHWPYLLFILQISSCQAQTLHVTATPTSLVTQAKNNISLICTASAKPILCLWKTPYGHIYTLSSGVFAESGRLAHLEGRDQCGLEIVGVEKRDEGAWQCEVGAVVRDDFKTATAVINLSVREGKHKVVTQQAWWIKRWIIKLAL